MKMFTSPEYVNISPYTYNSRDTSGAGDLDYSSLPPHLQPPTTVPASPWCGVGVVVSGRRGSRSQLSEEKMDDFIMVAEFSEIEGPKPVLTIPKDAGTSIDQNALSVKIMAVDHQTSADGGFGLSEDAQVVLSDDESGVSAFVHHFVLCDNQARGFVRPYCMVFVSFDFRKIMMFYDELSSQFKRAARFLKYGNRLLFVKDLECHLQDLEHTKGYLLNQVSRMRLKGNGGSVDGEESKVRSNAENELYKTLKNIHQSTTEIREILSIMKPLLHDHRLESRFRMLEERAFHRGTDDQTQMEKLSLQEDHFADSFYSDKLIASGDLSGSLKDSISPVSLFATSSSHTPLLVETKKAKRFNCPLRGLHELCSWGAKEGLRKLRCIHEYFKKDSMLLVVDKNESRLTDPTNSMIIHGHCLTTNVQSGITMRGSSLCMSEDSSSLQYSAGKLHKWPSFASDDTVESFKSVDSYLSLRDDEESASVSSFLSMNSGSICITNSASAHDFVSAPQSPMTEEVAFPSPSPPGGVLTALGLSPRTPMTTLGLSPRTPLAAATYAHDNARLAQDSEAVSGSPFVSSYDRLDNDSQMNGSPELDVLTATSAISISGSHHVHIPSTFCINHDVADSDNLYNNASTLVCDSPTQKRTTLGSDKDSGVANAHHDVKWSLLESAAGSDIPGKDSADCCIDGGIATAGTMNNMLVKATESHEVCREQARPQDSKTAFYLDCDLASPSTSSFLGQETRDKETTVIQDRNAALQGDPVMHKLASFKTREETAERGLNWQAVNTHQHLLPGRSSHLAQQLKDLQHPAAGNMLTPAQHQMGNADSEESLPFLPIMTRRRAEDSWQKAGDSLNDSPTKSPADSPRRQDMWKLESTESLRSSSDCVSIGHMTPDDSGLDTGNISLLNSVSASCSDHCLWKPALGVLTCGDALNSLGPGRPGHGILYVMQSYGCLQPVLFSLMTGRTVLVVGPAKMELEVTRVVTALSIFVLETKRKQHCVVEWMNRPLKVTDLTHIRLAGICRSEKRSFDATVPVAVKQYSTMFDVERRVIVGPLYQGGLINGAIQQRKVFRTDMQYVAFIHSWLMELSMKAFIFYHSFCLGEAGGQAHCGLAKHKEQYSSSVVKFMNRLGVRDSDIIVIEYMTEKVKMSQVEPHIWGSVDKGSVVQPLTVMSRGSHTFRC